MAETFVPTTTQTGQGGAQVINIDAIPTDSGVAQGIAGAGQGIAQGIYQFGAAEAAKQQAKAKAEKEQRDKDERARLDAAEEARKVAAGEYPKYNEAIQTVTDDFYNSYLTNKDIAYDDLMVAQKEWSDKIKAIEVAQAQDKSAMDYFNSHRDIMAFDPETGGYESAYIVRGKELAKPLNEDEAKLTLEGRFPDVATMSQVDFGDHLIPYDEKFSLGDETTKRFKEWAAQNGFTQEQISSLNNEYDVKKVVNYLPEASKQDFIKYMKSPEVRGPLERKWFMNTLVQENLPTRQLNLADPELAIQTNERYDEAIDNIILPNRIKESATIVQKPEPDRVFGAGEGGNDQWTWIETKVDRTSPKEGGGQYVQTGLKKFTLSRIDQPENKEVSFPDSRKEKGAGKEEIRLVPLSVEEKTPGQWVLSGGKSIPIYQQDEDGKTKIGDDGKPVPVLGADNKPEFKWEVIEIPYTSEVAAKLQTNTAGKKGGGFNLDNELKKSSSAKKYKAPNGYEYSREELKSAGWTDAQIDAL